MLSSLILGAPFSLQAASGELDSPMLAALAASGPHSTESHRSTAFDRIIGAWDFDCTIHPADGKSYDFQGEWIFDWVLDGRAIQDVWIGYRDGRERGRRHLGTTFRFFDPKLGAWNVTFIVPGSGKIIHLQGGEIGDRIVLDGVDVSGAHLRWSFNDIKSDSFLWRGETSLDGGKTWRVEQIMRLRRKQTT